MDGCTACRRCSSAICSSRVGRASGSGGASIGWRAIPLRTTGERWPTAPKFSDGPRHESAETRSVKRIGATVARDDVGRACRRSVTRRAAVEGSGRRAGEVDRGGSAPSHGEQGSELHDPGAHQGGRHRPADVLPVLSRARTISSWPSLRTSSTRTAQRSERSAASSGSGRQVALLRHGNRPARWRFPGAVPASSRRSISGSRRSIPAEVSRATQPFTELLVEEIHEAMATGHCGRPTPTTRPG